MNTLDYIVDKFGVQDWWVKKMPIEIRDFGRDNLAGLFRELGFTSGAEIGVRTGLYSEVLCKANPNLKLYSIDPWDLKAYFLHDESHVRGDGHPLDQYIYDGYRKEAYTRLAPYNCEIIQKYSLDAIEHFADNSLDFVYLDGNHDFQNCVNDICEWSRKVRSGGIVAGHDYARFRQEARIHVVWAVGGYTRSYNIRPWFVLGADNAHEEGITRDDYRSWMWVKP